VFVFGYDDVAHLFFAPRLSAIWMKEFVYAAPEETWQHLKRSGRFFKKWVLMKDELEHGSLQCFLHLGFNAQAIHRFIGYIQ
jgi:hypothetical protein